MIERILLIFWGVWLLLILIAAFRVGGFNIARRQQDRRWKKGPQPQESVALIVAVKGFDLQATPRFFDSIFAQKYPNYRVIVCFESWDDPVALWLGEHLELGPRNPVWTHPEGDDGLRSVTLVCAGLAENEGQKVHNQRAAFRDLNTDDAVIAFADVDIACGPDWLSRLVTPISQGTHTLSTTYRWLVPKRPTLPNQLASVINASITTQGGSALTNVLWGGSMAISRPVFDSLNVSDLFAGSLNDDLRLSKAARKAGNRVAFVRSLIIPTVVDFTWSSFFEFVKRQYTQVRFFSPILYTGINLVLGFYILGALSIVAALIYGYFYAWIPIAAAYIIDQFRALARQQVYLSLFPENGIRQKLFAAGWLEHMLTPFWIGLHWLLLASTWTQNKLTWAGIRYRIRSVNKTQILSRPAGEEKLPAGAPGLAMLGALHDRRRGTYSQPITRDSTEIEELVTSPATTEAPIPAVVERAGPSKATVPSHTTTPADHIPPARPRGASAVRPLTTTILVSDRSLRCRKVTIPSQRGATSAPEVALTKTRILTSPRFPIPTPLGEETRSGIETHPLPSGGSRKIATALSTAEILLKKTRLEGAVLSPKLRPTPTRAGTLPMPTRTSLEKTRVRPAVAFPVPATRPGLSSVPPVSSSSTVAPIPSEQSRSLAARRAHSGASIGHWAGPVSPPLSARAPQASRAADGRPGARPRNRRPSGRH